MISVVGSWTIIACSAVLFGYGIINLMYKRNRDILGRLDIYLVIGLMCINVYAQVFSLMYKVSGIACLMLLCLGGLMAIINFIVYRRNKICLNTGDDGLSIYQWIAIGLVMLATIAWTNDTPKHYDTALYHNQAIKWIEEYGVVCGLGNLHNRFAYNSAVMPLQALFSLEWLLDQSLHTLNGFVCCMFLAYAVVSNSLWKKYGKVLLSDMFKLATIIYIFYTREVISSPSSDILAMLLVLYVCTKWSEFMEQGVDDAIPYTLLSVICVWAVTIKLSVATCVLLAIYPAVLLIREKRWKSIAGNIMFGLTVAIPWLLRNVIISGYLLYPYPQIDLFDVDWKMPAPILELDSREIIVYGRTVNNVKLFDMPIWEWFPIWFENSSPKVLIVLGIVSAVIILTFRLLKLLKEKKINAKLDILLGYSIISLIIWLLTAPLMRYGMVYLLIPICMLVTGFINNLKEKEKTYKYAKISMMLICIPIGSLYLSKVEDINNSDLIMQENYEWRLTEEIRLPEGWSVWVPAEGDRGSYDVFPSTPYRKILEKIELRGDGLEDGFRIKQEYKNEHLDANGYEW